MPAFQYVWGVERPNEKIKRHTLNATVGAAAARAEAHREFEEARQRYQARLIQIDKDVEDERQQIELVRLSTPGGRYKRDVAQAVAAEFGLAEAGAPEKRKRGRPPKYGPNDPRPRRPSRAKTRAGRLRAKATLVVAPTLLASPASDRAALITPATIPIETVELVRGAASDIVTSQQRGPETAEVPQNDLVTEEPHPEAIDAAPFDIAAAIARHQNATIAALQRLSHAPEVAADIDIGSFLRAHRKQHHAANQWHRGKDGARMHAYDFSDALDEAKVAPEVRAIFKGFGLACQSPTYDENDPEQGISEVDLQLWMKRVFFNGEDYPEAHFDRYLEECKSAKIFYNRFERTFENEINRERLRIEIWPSIERRLLCVEMQSNLVAGDVIVIDAAKCRIAEFDYGQMTRISYSAQKIYRETIDAMKWFEGFSRLELAGWSEHDPENIPLCRESMGFPNWIFPKRLHNEVMDGHMFQQEPDLIYAAPTRDELISFATSNRAMRIANIRQHIGIDYADIDLPPDA